jgi:hypothetical protein
MKKPKKLFMIRKFGGDDSHSWAVFDVRGGRPAVTGCTKREAEYHRDALDKKFRDVGFKYEDLKPKG